MNSSTFLALRRIGRLYAISEKHYLKAVRDANLKSGGIIHGSWFNESLAVWGKEFLDTCGCKIYVDGDLPKDLPNMMPRIFVGNHISYLDIPLVVSHGPAAFLSKAEIARWPFVGKIAKYGGTVFIKRESKGSRKKSLDVIKTAIDERQQSIAVFPSGTTSMQEEKEWRYGIFQFAKDNNVPVQPFFLSYDPLRAAAFIDKDLMLPHVLKLLALPSFSATLRFGKLEKIEDAEKQCLEMRAWVKEQKRQAH